MKVKFPHFSQANILIVGDVMLDRYWHGGTSRVSPEAPVPVVKVDQIEERPGGAGNVALNISSLGSQVSLIGLTGCDEAATALQTSLEAANVRCDFQVLDDKPTITKLRVISRHQQLIRLDFEEPFHDAEDADLAVILDKNLPNSDAVIFSDYAKGALHHVEPLITQAKKHGIPILVDPKGADFARYRGATIVTPNLHEFEAVVGTCSSEQDLVEKGIALLKQHQWEALLVTRGEQGMTLLREGKPELHLPAKAREVYDVTGAGDTVIATLAAALAAGDDMESAVALANLAAGIVVGKLGTAAISVPELRRALQQEGGCGGYGVMQSEQLAIAIEDAKTQGEKIVMTNGCFDILHAGHVAYLEEAKALGDRLIVAVNGDNSVTRLKGEGRPVNPVERRMAVLAGLGAVDWVVPFDEDTPENLINHLLPDVLVKGGDYKVEEIAGHRGVLANGGEVKILCFEDGVSTTAIIQDIKNSDV
ncbi:MAG: bifunctional D-glycero-beta-D-manno-heptose-7-phosphate kinase/D-glycero-beta-D-manno-heptose 1-phosphate adenylyltransferase HldE [Pseudomonadota bacterium]